MEIILSDFNIAEYMRRRIRELNGAPSAYSGADPIVEAYTTRRIRELRIEHEMREREIDLDNMALGGYTIVTLEAYGGKS